MRALSVLCIALMVPQPGCKAMLYPAARAFGSPAESELKECRAACERLKAGRSTIRIVVFPACNPVLADPTVGPGSAPRILAELQAGGFANAALATSEPSLAIMSYGGNQMRYSWNRAHAYGKWIRKVHPEGDFFFFAEVVASPKGRINGIHAYVLDARGTVAYHRLMNSHHFGKDRPVDQTQALGILLKVFLRDLNRPTLELFPRWGVG